VVCLCNCRWRFGSAALLSAGIGTAYSVVRDKVQRRSPTIVVLVVADCGERRRKRER